MKRYARDGARESPITLGIIGHPSGFHFHNAERQSVGDHFPHSILTGLPTPFNKCMAFIGRLIRAPSTHTADDPTRVVDAGCEKDRVGAIAERIHVERPFDSVLAVVMICTPNVVQPQIPLGRRVCEYDGAFAVRIPTAGARLQANKIGPSGHTLGNGHSCPFVEQPASNDVGAGYQRSVSRHRILGFQLAAKSCSGGSLVDSVTVLPAKDARSHGNHSARYFDQLTSDYRADPANLSADIPDFVYSTASASPHDSPRAIWFAASSPGSSVEFAVTAGAKTAQSRRWSARTDQTFARSAISSVDGRAECADSAAGRIRG